MTDQNDGVWFRRTTRRLGFGYNFVPITWQGWVMTVALAPIILATVFAGDASMARRPSSYAFFVKTKALFGLTGLHLSPAAVAVLICAHRQRSQSMPRGIDRSILVLLLDHGASVNLAATTGDTPLMVAADRYQASIVKVLLDHGGDPNAMDRDGNTVLIRAAASKHSWEEERKPLVPLLLAKGADPTRKNSRGVTALMLMAASNDPARNGTPWPTSASMLPGK